jgi:hypothetical protein
MNEINSQNNKAFFNDDQLSIDVTLDRQVVFIDEIGVIFVEE